MALPGGGQHEAPRSRLQRLQQWLGFASLVGYIIVAGLFKWVTIEVRTKTPF